jgi:uncharacterized membrane protein HdeD (DUF308 family)
MYLLEMHRTHIRVMLSRDDRESSQPKREQIVIILGVILVILGAVLNVSILYTIGAILLVIGVILWILGASGRAVGGRPHYW